MPESNSRPLHFAHSALALSAIKPHILNATKFVLQMILSDFIYYFAPYPPYSARLCCKTLKVLCVSELLFDFEFPIGLAVPGHGAAAAVVDFSSLFFLSSSVSEFLLLLAKTWVTL